MRVVYMSGPTLRSLLTKVKDLPVSKHSYVVYEIPCECGKVNMRKDKVETGRHALKSIRLHARGYRQRNRALLW